MTVATTPKRVPRWTVRLNDFTVKVLPAATALMAMEKAIWRSGMGSEHIHKIEVTRVR